MGELVRIRVEHSILRGVARAVYRQRINDLVHLLSDVCTIVNYRQAVIAGGLRDPDDEPILATAVASTAAYIVSLNTRDFPEGGQAGVVRFLHPNLFLAELEARHPDAGLQGRAEQTGRELP